MDNIMINDLWSMMHHSSYSIIIHHLSTRSRSWLQADIIMVDKTIVKLPRSLKTYTLSTAHNFTRINQKDSKWIPSKFCLGHPSVIWVLGLSFPNRIVCATPEQSLKILSKSGELTLPFQFLLRKEASFSKQLFFNMWVFPKIMVPQIIHFNRVFHYKPSILGYLYFWKHPCFFTAPRFDRYTAICDALFPQMFKFCSVKLTSSDGMLKMVPLQGTFCG